MSKTTCQQTETGTHLVQGRVTAVEGPHFLVESSWGRRICPKAAGCLMEPVAGDLVLAALAGEPDEQSYILTVLERDDQSAPVLISLHEGASIEAGPGRITVRAASDLSFGSTGHVGLSAESFVLVAREGKFFVRTLSMIGNRFDSTWEECRETLGAMRTTCMRWVQNLGDSLRRVRNMDETHASHVRTLASESLYAQGKFVNHTASEIVKIDGREVHLG